VINASIASVASREVNFCKDVTYLVPIDGSNALTFNEALTFCKTFQGEMALPESLEDEQNWCKKYQSSLERRHFYLPIHDNDGENLWTWEGGGNGTNLPYTNWSPTEPNGGMMENCTVVRIAQKESTSNEVLM
jgi:hypothetical protein